MELKHVGLIPAWTTSCMTLGKLLNLSEPETEGSSSGTLLRIALGSITHAHLKFISYYNPMLGCPGNTPFLPTGHCPKNSWGEGGTL